MKRLSIVLNVGLLAFTLFVMATDGPATKAAYKLFVLLLLGVPVFTTFALARGGGENAARFAAFLNVILLGAVFWALVDQYPHPEDPGVVPYAVLLVLTPIVSVVALRRGGRAPGTRSGVVAGGIAP